jgi:hypothetical protein
LIGAAASTRPLCRLTYARRIRDTQPSSLRLISLVGTTTPAIQHRADCCWRPRIRGIRAVIIHFQDVIDAPKPSQADEFSGFTLVFQGFGYLFMMFVANVCFFLGPLSEWLLRPRNVGRYRKIAFRLGFWCSVALPFGIPTFLLSVATFYPGYFRWASAAH